ncbi:MULTISPECIES: hypothetical protein [unclassified Psychrobacter]|uniref:hypothetical protein n=1 Tax=unclassified Psychrobacter TaxID=196806 RepID=UPI0025B39B89|nr:MULTISPECIES: hypothetical protein [unclassified Psychrobacter]MDN3452751.1 hypothetical protein [Psychrobacter sp. APC 3350]MDN3501533.1 hypothetical protein [Psychrobacter sp. 5A.1]
MTTQSDDNHAHSILNDTPSTSISDDTVSANDAEQTNANNNAQTLAPNTIILADALTDKTIAWRIHNCKISKKTVTQDLPLPFLYHYDSLDDVIKQTHPLTPALLAKFNIPMTAHEAAQFIGISEALLSSPWHVKVIGSLVVFSESLQLAVRLHWTNTGKETQQIYTKEAADAITAAFKDWQFFGRVDVLYKNTQQTLVSIDEQAPTNDQIMNIDVSGDYQLLPSTHALVIIAKLDADKVELPWFETAILERLE